MQRGSMMDDEGRVVPTRRENAMPTPSWLVSNEMPVAAPVSATSSMAYASAAFPSSPFASMQPTRGANNLDASVLPGVAKTATATTVDTTASLTPGGVAVAASGKFMFPEPAFGNVNIVPGGDEDPTEMLSFSRFVQCYYYCAKSCGFLTPEIARIDTIFERFNDVSKERFDEMRTAQALRQKRESVRQKREASKGDKSPAESKDLDREVSGSDEMKRQTPADSEGAVTFADDGVVALLGAGLPPSTPKVKKAKSEMTPKQRMLASAEDTCLELCADDAKHGYVPVFEVCNGILSRLGFPSDLKHSQLKELVNQVGRGSCKNMLCEEDVEVA